MFSSFTPDAVSAFFVPSSSASMILVFHRACTMPIRSPEPSHVVRDTQADACVERSGGLTVIRLGCSRSFESGHCVGTQFAMRCGTTMGIKWCRMRVVLACLVAERMQVFSGVLNTVPDSPQRQGCIATSAKSRGARRYTPTQLDSIFAA